MRKVYLEGRLGKEFGEEWTLAVNTPAEALQAIAVQRPGLRKFLADSEGIEGYDILVDDEPIGDLSEVTLSDPGMSQSYSFVPVTVGSKSKMLTMVVGVTLVAMTGGLGAGLTPAFMGSAGAAGTGAAMAAAPGAVSAAAAGAIGGASGVIGAQSAMAAGMSMGAAATAAGTSTTAILATQAASYLGMGLVLAGAAAMLTPEVDDGGGAEQAENYHFSGPINTVKQGGCVPLVYGRAIVGSTTISASLYSQTSRTKISKGRKLVGISDFRTDGSRFGGNASNVQGGGYGGGGGPFNINIGAAHR